MKIISKAEFQQHQTVESLWVQIGQNIYDLTKFLDFHPGGKAVLLEYGGVDATEDFLQFHSPLVLQKYEKFIVGKIENYQISQPKIIQYKNSENQIYGECIPFGDPNSIQGYRQKYYTQNHLEFRDACKKFVEKNIEPFIEEWEQNVKTPIELVKELGKQGVIALCIGYPFWFEKLGSKKVFGVELEKPDSFHEIIFYDEFSRAGSGGILWGLLGMPMFGLPPILKFGNQDLQDRIGTPCLKGEKIICLAITEPWVGSDVKNLQTKAARSSCGKYFIVNGLKKFITNGIFCDYFTTAVMTEKGMTMLVIEKNLLGVKVRHMKCSGMWSSGTSFVIFENVKVPVENIIGKEGNGFKQVVLNFNHERFMFLSQCNRLARICYTESFKYAHLRESFGKKLIEQPVIRQKLAKMIAQIESNQAWLEQITYNMDRMNQEQQIKILSGTIATCKAHSSQVLQFCASEAIQILGGKAYTRGGHSSKVERIYREVKAMAIPGGSEEILLDLGARNASKIYPSL